MAEERNLATARAADTAEGDDATKAELQRRMEEARESISHTVEEIKDTVTAQYQNVRETITDALDWREQFRRRPVAFSAGALAVGFFVGYGVAGAFKGDDDNYVSRSFNEYGSDCEDYDTDLANDSEVVRHAYSTPRAYAAKAITGAAAASAPQAHGRSQTSQGTPQQSSSPAPQPSYSEGYATNYKADDAESEDKPSLFDRFKETQAYDKLQTEVSNIGNRVVEELSKTAQNVVLPMLLSKLKDFIGVDLNAQSGSRTSGAQSGSQRSAPHGSQHEADHENESNAPSGPSVNVAAAGSPNAEAHQSGGANYATSDNVKYGSPS